MRFGPTSTRGSVQPKRSSAEGGVALVYRFDSEIPPVRPLRLKIEINTREHFAILGYHARQLTVDNPWFAASAEITTFQLDELLGTKLRALYQRRKGRDLFDLWLAISRGLLDPDRVVTCFREYLSREGHTVSRAQFEENLHDKQTDAGFLEEVHPLLSTDVQYDATAAVAQVQGVLVGRLPGDPWRGRERQRTHKSHRRDRKEKS